MNTEFDEYWRANLRLIMILMVIWFLVSIGFGIIWVEWLNQFQLAGFKLGFWFAQQGAVISFVILISFYVYRMEQLDKKYAIAEK